MESCNFALFSLENTYERASEQTAGESLTGLSPSISSQFTLEIRAASTNSKKLL